MKRNSTSLVPFEDAVTVEDENILTPLKLNEDELIKRMVDVCGFKFFDTGYALACPECGKVSGISCREDINKDIDFFLKFGCEHYKANEGEAPVVE